MQNVLIVAAGGAAGASARYLVGRATLQALGPNSAYGTMAGTMIVNVLGSLLMGLLVGFLMMRTSSEWVRLLLTTGFLGGFTTFSTFSLDFSTLWERGEIGLAFGYAAASVVLSLLAIGGGLWISRSFG